MDATVEVFDKLIGSAARRLSGQQRRLFQAEVADTLCNGSPRAAERRFGFGRDTVATGQHEAHTGIRCVEDFRSRAKLPAEVKEPQLAADIRAIVEPHTLADPELKSERRYTNLSAREVLEALQNHKGYSTDTLPCERSMRNILNRMGYRLKRIHKAKPIKKLPETDAIFDNSDAVKGAYKNAPETLEISYDAKAKVNEGDYSRGGKGRSACDGAMAKGWDHDPPPDRKWTPLGILILVAGTLTLIFGQGDSSDYWADGLKLWWQMVKGKYAHIKRLVIYLDNGPNNAGNRTQWLKRMVEFCDWSGLEIRLVYYPAYHSKYNPVEHCWGVLEKKWGATLLNCLKVILREALRMRWCGQGPTVKRLHGDYPAGVKLTRSQMKPYEARMERSKTLPKYDITIKPQPDARQVG